MPELFPAGYENETVMLYDESQDAAVGYKPGLRFSYAEGQLQQDGKQRLQDSTGVESWQNWCYNCLMTRRYHHLAYSTDFGIEVEEAFAAETREKAESLLTRQITEALQADPYGRTDYVSDIRFDWTVPDTVSVTVTVRGIDDVTIDVTANIKGDKVWALPAFLQNRSVDEVHQEMLAALPGDIDCSEGNHIYNLTRPAAIEIAKMCEFILPDVLALIFPVSAYGEWLDYHAQTRGLERRPATHATGSLLLSGAAGTVVPVGSQFSTAAVDDVPSVFYETMELVEIPENGSIEVLTQCVEAGTTGNTKENTILLKAAKLSGITSVTNPAPISGGTEEEGDESLRARIMELDAAKSVSYVGSVADYKRWSKEVPGVGEVTVIPAQDDSGLVTVVITDSNGEPASEVLCNAVYDHIMSPANPELRFVPPNARLLVTPPESIELTISVVVTIAQDSSLSAVLDSFVSQAQTYLATARADGEIRYTQIGKILAGTRGVYDYQDLALNGGTANIDITKTQLPQISRESVSLKQG